jgi:hypothetical protein
MAILTDVEDIEFVYPSKPWKLPLFCHLWFLLLFAYLYYGRIPDPFSPAYTSTVIGYLVIVGMWIWEWPARFLGADKPITLSQSGITANGRFAKWDDIQKIKHGPFFFFRHSLVYLKLKREKKSFFSISIRRRYLSLQGYPFVYREVLPAILGYRPDVPVSAVVKRNMEAPENSRGLHTWFVLLLLILYIILLYLISLDDFQTLICYIITGAILVLLSTGTSNFAVPFATTNRERFIEFAINNMLLIGVAIKLFSFSTSDYIVMEVLTTTAILVCIMAILVLLTTQKLSVLWRVCIIWVIVLSPICIYLYGKSQTWQPRDISHQLEKKDWNIPLWSFSGDYLTCLSYEENGFIIQVPSLKNVSVPEHIGRNLVVWFGNEYLLRQIESDDKTELWFYDFANDVEFKIPTGEKFSVGNKRPICHQEQYLAWIDFGEDVNNGDIRFWNLKKNIEDISTVSLPSEISWKGGQVVWLDQNRIAVCAKIAEQKGKEEGTKLAVLYLTLDGKERRLYISSKRFKRWYPAMDCQYAFGVNSLGSDRYSVTFVDLTTDESIELTGEDFPIFAPSSNYALRITYNSGKSYLTRFEFKTLKDFPLYRVPDNTKIIAVSKTGKFVLLGLEEDFLTIPVYYVFHVPSGKKHKIHFAGLGGFHSPEISAIYPGASNFSPNERFFLLNIAQGSDLKLLLYELPDSW